MPRLTDAFAYPEFRAVWLGRGLSMFGDQLARVALALLVFDHTGSAAWTGFVYALSYLPYLAGPLFAGLADRRPRRTVMIVLDVFRAVAVGLMALPGVPLAAMCVLLAAATAVTPVYDAARSATVPDTLPKELYATGLAACSMTVDTAQVLGFGFGGALVAAFGARPSLGLDALTFAAAAALTAGSVRRRPAPLADDRESMSRQLVTATRVVFGSPRLRALICMAWINALWMVPEALAAPYAARLHAGPVAVGMLLAAIPTGCAIGAFALTRVADHERRLRLMVPLALMACLPLLAMVTRPGLAVSLVLWVLCGAGTAYNVPANVAFVEGLPNERRGQAFALASTGIVTGQGLAALLAGAVASLVSPAAVIACTGLAGLVVVGALRLTWLRERRVIALPPAAIDLTAREESGRLPVPEASPAT